ncbi:flagellar biosynthesis protein FlhF [Aquabacterium sp. A7-Y]|uniref:flagellar biosynthesis protein FlhF n=1 Tax=Aquabacterium sp. A7-Y TaxID=1349605 RepID=UPI00223CC930|nr:flagellar biosynthesis protein FlhF [Aquabacterium sp. A7-Y]MCW7540522.1 flagellar biosynthesis protein FlhF [Aquabacterium sp. A7-Y]
MNVKRFVARTSRDALVQVRQAFGEDAVILSTRPCSEGVEVLAMAPDSVAAIEKFDARSAAAPARPAPAAPAPRAAGPRAAAPAAPAAVDGDVEKLAMSTLSFQDYVRERMLKRRQAALQGQAAEASAAAALAQPRAAAPAAALPLEQRLAERAALRKAERLAAEAEPVQPRHQPQAETRYDTAPLPAPSLHDEPMWAAAAPSVPAMPAMAPAIDHEQRSMLNELRQMKGLIEERFGALAFMEKLQRNPHQAKLTQKLLDCGFSPALIRKLAAGTPAEVGDLDAWVASVLQRNLLTGEAEAALEDQGGVYAMVGSTGVGKTTTTAKLAAAFAAKYGASNLGLITLDAYRVAAHEQLRAYGRIIGVAVHTAHDRPALEDLLDLLSAKKMVLIDTAGIAQRDSRTQELLEMVGHRSIQRLLVVNSAAQGETIEDVLLAYRAQQCKGVVLSKLDEAVKLGPALDAMIRHKLKVLGVANGQRVPEDWHRMSASALVHRALRGGGSSAYRLDSDDVNLVFTAPPQRGAAHAGGAHA